MNTVFGILCDRLGHASTQVLEQGARRPELRFKAWATPSAEIRAVQAPFIGVDRDHNGIEVGEVVYLERDKSARLWAIAHVHEDVLPEVRVKVGSETVAVEHDLYWSATRRSTEDYRDILVDSIALTTSPARIAATPVRFLAGALDCRKAADRWKSKLSPAEHELLTRAAHAHRNRGRTDPLVVHDLTPPSAAHHNGFAVRSAPPVEIRSAEQVGVSTAARIIQLIVAPYETAAVILHKNRWIREIYTRGSFDDIGKQGNKVRANRDHDVQRTVGRAVAFHPHHPEGLVAEIRIAETELGNETLALAADDCLSASAGFRCLEERWQGEDTRLIIRGWLDHVGLVPSPAYASADVLAVRGGDVAAGLR